MGDITQAVIIGSAIQILYIGTVAAGSNFPADDCLAGLIAIPRVEYWFIANAGHYYRRTYRCDGVSSINSEKRLTLYLCIWQISMLRRGNVSQIKLALSWQPTVLRFLYPISCTFLANMYGKDIINSFLNSVPGGWFTDLVAMAGGVASGARLCPHHFCYRQKELLPWFLSVISSLTQFSGIPVFGAAIFGLSAVLLISYYQNKKRSVRGW